MTGCEAFGTGMKIDTSIKEILVQRSRFSLPAGSGGGALGESKSKPAPSCSFIKSVYKNSTNGFYWIKNDFSKTATKVYCEMKADPSYGISVENSLDSDVENMVSKLGLKEPTEFLKACSKYGMTLAKIESPITLSR